MRIKALAAVVVLEDGSRWAVTALAREGRRAVLRAEPGYHDPPPVELGPGWSFIPSSTLDGSWAVALSGVGPVELRRLAEG